MLQGESSASHHQILEVVYKSLLAWYTNKLLPEAPPVIILAIRCDPHQDLLPRAERVPQTVQVAVLNVQDCDGSLPGKRKQSTERLLVKVKHMLNCVFVSKTQSFYHCQHLRADTVTLQHHPLLICHWKCWIIALWIKLCSSPLLPQTETDSGKDWFSPCIISLFVV